MRNATESERARGRLPASIETPAPAAGPTASHLAAVDTLGPKEEIVERLFEAFSRRDLRSVLSLMHPEIIFQPKTAEVTQGGAPYRGHAGLLRYSEDVETYWEELAIRPIQVRAAGHAVVVLGLASGKGPAGSFADVPTTWVIKFKDGLVSHAQIFSDTRHVEHAFVGAAAPGAAAPGATSSQVAPPQTVERA